jgi:hypothetical protein
MAFGLSTYSDGFRPPICVEFDPTRHLVKYRGEWISEESWLGHPDNQQGLMAPYYSSFGGGGGNGSCYGTAYGSDSLWSPYYGYSGASVYGSAIQAQMMMEQQNQRYAMLQQQQQYQNQLKQLIATDPEMAKAYAESLANAKAKEEQRERERLDQLKKEQDAEVRRWRSRKLADLPDEKKDLLLMTAHKLLKEYDYRKGVTLMWKGITAFLFFLGVAVWWNFPKILNLIEVALKCSK